jgi:hypothetical protein
MSDDPTHQDQPIVSGRPPHQSESALSAATHERDSAMPAAASQGGSAMSELPPDHRDSDMSGVRVGKRPVQTAASPPIQQTHQDNHAESRTRDQQPQGPAYPLINHNKNLENQVSRTYDMMLNHFENSNPEEAEKVAHILLAWGNLPVLYRAYAHIVSTSMAHCRRKLTSRQVLAHGLHDCLFHAQKAVEEIKWGMNKYDDEKGAVSRLLAVAMRLLQKVEEAEARRVEQGESEEGEEISVRNEVEEEVGAIIDKPTGIENPAGAQSEERHVAQQHAPDDSNDDAPGPTLP